MINCRKPLAKRNINRAFPRNNPPGVKAKGNCLSVPLSHLFFSLPSHNCLKYTNTILSFHRQKVYVTAYITEKCGMFIYWAHQQVLLSSIASPYLIPTLSSAIWSAKEEASSFRVRCPQPRRLPVCGTRTGEPDWKLQEGRDAASTGTVSLGPELDKQAPLPGHGREEKTGPGHGCVVAKFTQPATGTSTVPITLASLSPGLAHLHDLEAPLCSSIHPQNRSARGARPRARAGLCPGPRARVTCPQPSRLWSRQL